MRYEPPRDRSFATTVHARMHDLTMKPSELLLDAARPQTDEPWNEPPDVVCDRIHRALIDVLAVVMPAASFKQTSFCNHSFVPDLVACRGEQHRDIYMRFGDGTDAMIASDIAYTGSEGPVFVCLGGLDELARPTYDPAAVKYADRCLVVPACSLDALAETPGAYTEQVLARGKGFLDAETARAAAGSDAQALRRLLDDTDRHIQVAF